MSTPPSAVQPDATTTLTAPVAPFNAGALAALGAMLRSKFTQYEQDRRVAELQWERNARQYLGVYDPDIISQMDKNRSRAYPKITRVKCVSMLSRLMNLLFPTDDKNWTVAPSAVPELSEEDLQGILDTLSTPSQPGQPPAPPDDEAIEQAIRDLAQKRADRMELEIEDQLQELGGARAISYTSLCRKVLASGIQYGAGILKGPFVAEQMQRTWSQDATGKLTAVQKTAYRPRFEFTSLWDYYPDMTAKTLSQMDGQFERVVMSRHQTIALKSRPDFLPAQIDKALQQMPTGNYVRRAFETELRAIGPQLNTNSSPTNKYEAYIWEGFVSGRELSNIGVPIKDSQVNEDVKCSVWILGDTVIKVMIDPWSSMGGAAADVPKYHHFIFEENETFLLGNGLPNIVRDSQMGVCAATRMMLDNGSIQRVAEVNVKLLTPGQDIRSLEPDMIIYRDDEDASTVQYPAVRYIEIPMHLEDYGRLVTLFQGFADQETFVSAGTGGDMQKGPSEPFRTATGASMLRGDAALPFKDVVRNFDCFTESVINAILIFNKTFNPNPKIDGDFMPVARGATSLIAKEVLGIQLDALSQSLSDEEKRYLKPRELLRAKVRVRDMRTADIVMNDSECDKADAAAATAQQAQQQQQTDVINAQIKETLASALKDLAQAGKNTAAAQAEGANVILNSLDKGINPDTLTPQGASNGASGGTIPAPVAGSVGQAATGGMPAANDPGLVGAGDAGAAPAAAMPAATGGFSTAAMPVG
jgi:hypothetical protein